MEKTIQEIPVESEIVQDVVKLANKLHNVNILRKGMIDIISNGKRAFLVGEPGSLKRSGGIGDILSGLTTLYGYWGNAFSDEFIAPEDKSLIGCVLASYITRKASFKAYDEKKFSLTAPNIIEKIGESFNEFYFTSKL